jgi:hypothetical protein
MFDGNLDSCWNSDQGSPQFIIIDFCQLSCVKKVQFSFQGGFVGQEGYIYFIFIIILLVRGLGD